MKPVFLPNFQCLPRGLHGVRANLARHTWLIGFPLLFLLLLVAGCAAPRREAPPAAQIIAPDHWGQEQSRHTPNNQASTTSKIELEWWKQFGDEHLDLLVDRALQNNIDLAIAVSRVEESRAQLGLASAQQQFNSNLALDGGRQGTVSAFGRSQIQNVAQGQVIATYDLDLFRRLADTTAASRASLLASQAAHDTVRLAIISGITSAYFSLCALDARLALLHDTVNIRTDSLKIARRRADKGYASRLELHQAEAELRATEQLIPATELAIARQLHALNLLLGDNPSNTIQHAAHQFAALHLPAVPVSLPSDLLRQRPDIAQAEQQLAASDHLLDAARDAFLPSIRLNASAGLVDASLLNDPIRIFSLGGSILAPLFDQGRLRAQADAAVARRDQAAFAYRRTALNAFREVEDAMAANQHNTEQEKALLAQRDALARSLQLAANRYRSGYSSYIEQIDAQRSLLSAELSLVQVRNDRLLATLNLFQSLGGGWQAQAEK